ncbi:MAG TPA: DUF490 domain-containing protein, partial [Ramlibacter sp.]|nr:DUF490 domain-containing protein [Ramlibacter sp.]
METAGRRAARWVVRILMGLAALLVAAAAGLWWWSGQEGSLEWLLKRIASGGALTGEGVRGALRGRWTIERIIWERDGLRLVAEDIVLEWQPIALLNRTLQLEKVQAARASVTDRRATSNEPLKPPSDLRLPWRVNVEELKVGKLRYDGRVALEASALAARYGFDGLRHRAELQSLQVAGGAYSGELSMLAMGPLTLDARVEGRFQAPIPGSDERVPLAFELRAEGPARAIDARAELRVTGPSPGGEAPQATASARIAPFDPMPVPRAAADFRRLDLALFWPAAPRTQLSGHVDLAPAGSDAWRLQADVRNAAAGPWDAGRLPVASARGEGEWRNGTALVKALRAELGGGTLQGSGAWQGQGWRFAGRVDAVDPSALHRSLAPLPLTGPLELRTEDGATDFDVALQAGAARTRRPAPRAQEQDDWLGAAGALELRSAQAEGRWSGDALAFRQLRVRTSDATLEGSGEVRIAARAGEGRVALTA